MIRQGCPNRRWRISSSARSMIMSPILPNQMTTGCEGAFSTGYGAVLAAVFDSSRAALRPLAREYTAACGTRPRRHVGNPGEAAAGHALFRGDQPQFLETRLDRAQRAAVLARNGDRRLAALEGGDEPALLFGRPCLADVVGQLRAPLRAGGRLLERREPGEQRPKDIGVLQHRLAGQLLTGDGVEPLDERLQYLSCPGLGHDESPL